MKVKMIYNVFFLNFGVIFVRIWKVIVLFEWLVKIKIFFFVWMIVLKMYIEEFIEGKLFLYVKFGIFLCFWMDFLDKLWMSCELVDCIWLCFNFFFCYCVYEFWFFFVWFVVRNIYFFFDFKLIFVYCF